MHPILLKLGFIEIRAYGALLALSFLIGFIFATRNAKKHDINPQNISDILLFIMIGAIAGARLFYVFFHWSDFQSNLLGIINPFENGQLVGIAGMNMYGGVIGAMILGFWYLIHKKLNIWKIADYMIPYLALGTAMTRIGCFLNGCCFGNPTECSLGMVFPKHSIPDTIFPGIHIHPTQLYSSLFNLIFFFVLLFIQKKKKFHGTTFFSWIIGYAIFRFLVEFIRYYEEAMILFKVGEIPITMNQIIAVILVIVAIVILFLMKISSDKTKANA